MAYRLRAGDTGPVQQSPVTCGSACLVVARMLVDPLFASWIRTGTPRLPGSPDGATQAERFAAYERVVMRRTNGILAAGGRPQLPWPRQLGTPPWGALRELELGAARRGTRYVLDLLRTHSEGDLVDAFDTLLDVVAEGEPALLYVGNAVTPRHVVLVLPGDGDRMLDVYDPATGTGGPPAPGHGGAAAPPPQRLGRALARRAADPAAVGSRTGIRSRPRRRAGLTRPGCQASVDDLDVDRHASDDVTLVVPLDEVDDAACADHRRVGDGQGQAHRRESCGGGAAGPRPHGRPREDRVRDRGDPAPWQGFPPRPVRTPAGARPGGCDRRRPRS